MATLTCGDRRRENGYPWQRFPGCCLDFSIWDVFSLETSLSCTVMICMHFLCVRPQQKVTKSATIWNETHVGDLCTLGITSGCRMHTALEATGPQTCEQARIWVVRWGEQRLACPCRDLPLPRALAQRLTSTALDADGQESTKSQPPPSVGVS